MLSPGEHPEQLSAVAAFSVCDSASATHSSPRPWRGPTFSPPVSAQQWVDVATSCLRHNSVPLEALMGMMEDTSRALTGDDEAKSCDASPLSSEHCSQSPASSEIPLGSDARDRVGVGSADHEEDLVRPATDFPTTVSTRRWLAARFLLLGSRLGVQGGTEASLREAVRLAESAVTTHYCSLTGLQLAWAYYSLGCHVQEACDRGVVEERVGTLLEYCTGGVIRGGLSSPMDALLLMKVVWLSALTGRTERSLEMVKFLLQKCQDNAETLVLKTLLLSSFGEYEEALRTASYADHLFPHDVVCGIVLIAIQNMVDNTAHHEHVCVERALAVLVARVEAASRKAPQDAVAVSPSGVFSAPDSTEKLFALDDMWSSRGKHESVIAGHWALLAHVAQLVGCESVAQLGVDAGLEYICSAGSEHRQAYCDLMCTAARIKIDRIEKSADSCQTRRDGMHVWGPVSQLRGATRERQMDEQRKLLSDDEMLSLDTILGKALEVGTRCAEAYCLLGRVALLTALGPGNALSARESQLVMAAHYFQLAIDCDPRLGAAHEGMGHVREEQGAIELSLDCFAVATEMVFREPIVPYERFLYTIL